MKFILAKKLEMSQVYQKDGTVIPVTLLEAGPCEVTAIKTPEKDGYAAVQVGFGARRKSFRFLREFRVSDTGNFERGTKLEAALFAPGETVTVVGTSKGLGFQGVVKRHGFHGSPKSHGHKDQLRMPGSIGSKRQGPVEKGKRMAGRMGGERVTVKNLLVMQVDQEKNRLAVKGAVPGARGSLVLIYG